MPVFVTLGRYTESAIKGMLAKPEDRTAVVKKLIEQAGGKQLAWYVAQTQHSCHEGPSYGGTSARLAAYRHRPARCDYGVTVSGTAIPEA